MEGAPWRGRNRLVSGAAETRAQQPAGHREPLFLGSEPWGPGHTRPEQDLAQLLCRAQGQHPAIPGPSRVLPLTGRTGKEKEEKKKLGNGPSLPFPHSGTVSNTHSALVSPPAPPPPWAGEVTLGAQSECSGEEILLFPFSNTPSSHGHVQGAV